MSARAANTCASLMKVGPSSASGAGQPLGAAPVVLGVVAAARPAEDQEPAPVAQERDDERQQPAEDDERTHRSAQSNSHPARPSSSRNPQTSVKVVTKIDEAIAGSTPAALQHDRDERAGESGHQQVAGHREEHHEPEAALPRP